MEQHLFKCLESNERKVVDDAKTKFRDQFDLMKEAWLVNGLVDYFLVTNSIRAVDVLVAIREPHDKFFFDRLAESLRCSPTRLAALTLLGHVVQRQPTWLYKIMRHPSLMKDLLKILKTEIDLVEVISALLVLNVLLPMIPGLIGPHLNDIFHVFSRLAAWNSDNPNKMASSHLLHLQVALYALFYQLYAMFPCLFLAHLQKEYNMKNDTPSACNVFNHTVKPMIETVRLHPFLIMSSSEEETGADRWKKSEHHDVVFNCTRFLLDASERPYLDDSFSSSSSCMKPPHPFSSLDTSNSLLEISRFVEPASPSVSSAFNYLNSGVDTTMSSLCSRLDVDAAVSGNSTPAAATGSEATPTSIPHTPIFKLYSSSSFSQHEGSSPPEAAIEATPETTPVKDVRYPSRPPPGPSTAVRALHTFPSPNDMYGKKAHGDTPPSSPMKGKDIFNFPSSIESTRAVSKLLDERLIAQEASFTTGKDRKSSAPSSPFNIFSSLDTLCGEEKDADICGQNSSQVDSINKEHTNFKQRSDLIDGDIFDEDCSQDSGSPCSRGGLHMPDSAYIRFYRPRRRYLTERSIPTSQSLGVSIGSNHSEGSNFPSVDNWVRRAYSCPEIKKTATAGSLSGLKVLDEVDESKTGKPVPPPVEDRSTQTDDSPPNVAPYEHLFLGIFPVTFCYHQTAPNHYGSPASNSGPLSSSEPNNLLSGHSVETSCVRKPNEPAVTNAFKPYESLDRVVDVTTRHRSKSNAESELRFYKEQLVLMNLQLNFERHRREVHSERNRRLLGKSRTNRALEEHNSALRDQVSLLQKDIETSVSEIRKCQTDCRTKVEHLESNMKRLKTENGSLHKEICVYKSRCESLEQEIKSESEKRSILNQILHETKAKLFDSNNEMENYKQAVIENKKLNTELSYLQKEIIILGEMNSKYKDILSYLAQLKNETVYSDLFKDAYVYQIDQLKQLNENQAVLLESIRNKNIKLEKELFEKDKTLQQFKTLFASIKHQYTEELEDMTSRYNSVQASMNRQRKEQLELYYQVVTLKNKVKKYEQKYPSLDKAVTSSLGPIPSTSQPNNPNNLSLSSFVVHESDSCLEPRTDPTEFIEKD